jgi:pyruvate kinase
MSDHITHMMCDLARQLHADAILTPTVTGRTARIVSRHRPAPAIVAVANDANVRRQLALTWGVHATPFVTPPTPGEDRIDAALRAAFRAGAVKPGHLVLALAGHPIEGAMRFPTLRVVRVGPTGQAICPD